MNLLFSLALLLSLQMWWAIPPPLPVPLDGPSSPLLVRGEIWRIVHRAPPRAFGQLRGLTLCRHKLVFISPDQEARDTLFHELIHISFGCTHADEWDSLRYSEEDVALAVTPELLKLLRDNPATAEELFGAAPCASKVK